MVKNHEIQIRDPFVYPEPEEKKYYLFGSTDPDIWGKGTGFDVYIGKDLENWEGPFPVFRPETSFFSEDNFWAPEVYPYNGDYYMFSTFLRKDNNKRGTAVLKSNDLLGPFLPHSDGPITPASWFSLDGTLYVDEKEKPWMVFCHEWVQVGDGEICAVPMTRDLKERDGEPELLFRASEVPWPTPFQHPRHKTSVSNYVTDGPFLYKNTNDDLLLLWSSFRENAYALGISKSISGHITGPWEHRPQPVYTNDGGHGMLFRDFENNLRLALHAPNTTPNERPIFVQVNELKV
ncbi:glycoside hydrolase family 43 protein [Salibacterium aidingense]|uniref:glycoside hydrolase family 43 protein n=1 Tax=Salibacterium aidingense TaxID=384933 RepID=UPI00041292AB|nr:glycoside hydrolase family 43 protein [Salibacterium aidingense]